MPWRWGRGVESCRSSDGFRRLPGPGGCRPGGRGPRIRRRWRTRPERLAAASARHRSTRSRWPGRNWGSARRPAGDPQLGRPARAGPWSWPGRRARASTSSSSASSSARGSSWRPADARRMAVVGASRWAHLLDAHEQAVSSRPSRSATRKPLASSGWSIVGVGDGQGDHDRRGVLDRAPSAAATSGARAASRRGGDEAAASHEHDARRPSTAAALGGRPRSTGQPVPAAGPAPGRRPAVAGADAPPPAR